MPAATTWAHGVDVVDVHDQQQALAVTLAGSVAAQLDRRTAHLHLRFAHHVVGVDVAGGLAEPERLGQPVERGARAP